MENDSSKPNNPQNVGNGFDVSNKESDDNEPPASKNSNKIPPRVNKKSVILIAIGLVILGVGFFIFQTNWEKSELNPILTKNVQTLPSPEVTRMFTFLEYSVFEPQNEWNSTLWLEKNHTLTLIRTNRSGTNRETVSLQISEDKFTQIESTIRASNPKKWPNNACVPDCPIDRETRELTIQIDGETFSTLLDDKTLATIPVNLAGMLTALKKQVDQEGTLQTMDSHLFIEPGALSTLYCACGHCCSDAKPEIKCVQNEFELNEINNRIQTDAKTTSCQNVSCAPPVIYQICGS